MFLFKKLVAPFLDPFLICLELLLAGLVVLWFTRHQRLGKWLITISFALIVVLGQGSLPAYFVEQLESQYLPLDLTSFAHQSILPPPPIVVLSGGHVPDPTVPLTSQISRSSLVRLIEGIRLHQALPGSILVLSGGPVSHSVPEAETMAEVAQSIGVNRADIVVETVSRNTAEHAEQLQGLLGEERFILVTSAVHMPRTMRLFEKWGMRPTPAPTDHLVVKVRRRFSPYMLIPAAGGFTYASTAIHEYLGLAWAKLRGKISRLRQ